MRAEYNPYAHMLPLRRSKRKSNTWEERVPKERVVSDEYHMPVPSMPDAVFTQAIRATGGRTWIFVSGITARDKHGAIVAIGDIEGQTRQVLENIRAILKEAGAGLGDVVKIVTYVRNANDLVKIGRIRREYFEDRMPATTSVEVSRLAQPDQLIEIDAIAIVD
jgi:enamine deaminase RidA (YjgF/YER057c/UK114 family)